MDLAVFDNILFLINFINFVSLVPIVYTSIKMLVLRCLCGFNLYFIVIFVYVLMTLVLLLISFGWRFDFIDLRNKNLRIAILAYFLFTILFIEMSERYLKEMEGKSVECECFKQEKTWLISLMVIRWVGVYFFGLILVAAGMYLFVRSKERIFSFPRSAF